MCTLSVVIPAYNEENGIAEIMERVLSIRPALKEVGVDELELLVVDDGSKDQTGIIAQKIADRDENVFIITHEVNKGYGGALKTGFSRAKGELIGFLDADGTYPPEYFPLLCEKALNGADLVIGSRMAGEQSQMPATRRVGNIFFAGLLTMLGWQKITDSASGMRVVKREILSQIYPLPNGLNLTPVMSTRAVHEGVRMCEVPIPYSERIGRSKLSVIRDGLLFLQSMVWTVMAYNPVRVLGIMGLAGVFLAFLSILGLVMFRLAGVTTIGPWGVAALFAGMVAGVTGVALFALGATSNYLVSLFYKKNIRQGLFGKPIFKKPLESRFGLLGSVTLLAGLVLSIVSLILGISGWEIERLWLYLLGGAMMILVGVQLILYWALMRVLDDLSQRELLIRQDLNG
ncbi:MAG: glycosyl transferase [Bellilinea sp.]|nr:MAG: glycosyl transferase [Bellilinea sp.]